MLGSNRRFLYVTVAVVVGFLVLAWINQRDTHAPGEISESKGLHIQSWKSDSGANVLFVETRQLPMIDVRVVFDAGSARDTDKPGLARLTNVLLDHGAGEWDTDSIADRFESVGAISGASALRDSAVVSLRSLVDPTLLEQALTTLTAVLQKPHFNPDELERERSRTLVALENDRQSPSSIAEKVFYANLYPQHPYHTPSVGNEDSVKSISIDDVKEFYNSHYTAKNAVIAIVGAVDRDAATKIANQISAELPEGNAAAALPDVADLTQSETINKTFPSTQSHILIGQPGMRRGDPDYFALYVGNHILGGSGFGSRIVEEIREKRGLAYSSYSYFLPMRKPGPFTIGMQTRGGEVEKALSILDKTLREFIDEGPSAEELQHAKKNITGGFPLRIDSNKDIVEYIGMIGFYNLPLNYLQTFNDNVNAVTAEQIQDAFQRRVKPDKLLTVVVGSNSNAKPVKAGSEGS